MQLVSVFALVTLCSSGGLAAQEAADADSQETELSEKELRFQKLLSGARMVGFFTLTNAPGDQLKEDSYTLTSVTKTEGDKWRFEASVEYRETAIPVALELPVLWAGDTPVITVDKISFPLLGEYSAHVLFTGDQYAGTWSGKDYGGHMFGRIEGVDSSEPMEGEVEDASAPAGADKEVRETGFIPSAGEAGAKAPVASAEGSWPSFRGPRAMGVAEGYGTPIAWDIESGENVKWRVPVPGLAHSSPVVWGDKLFVTTAVRKAGEQELTVGLYGNIQPVADEGDHTYELHCLDRKTGATLWKQVCWEGTPEVKRHTKGSHAACTPATDGKRVLAFFGGEGLYCYDMEGELLWSRDFGVLDSGYYVVPTAQWGFASSPVLHDDKVVLQCDIIGEESFVAVLDAKNGEDIWRTVREEVPTWSTPTVEVREERSQVICNGYKHIGGYDLATGKELWRLEGGGDIPVPTPIVSHDLIFITNAHGRYAPILAIDVNATGTFTMDEDESDQLAWSDLRRGNYMQTPLIYGEEIYLCNDAGILSCYDAAEGYEIYRERLGEGRTGFTGSGVAADGKLYFTSEEGDVYVVQAGRGFEVLAANSLGEEFMSSPAISKGVVFFRTRGHLVAVGE